MHFVMMDDRNHTDKEAWECYKTDSSNLELLKNWILEIIQNFVLGRRLKLRECVKLFFNEGKGYILASCSVKKKPKPLEASYSKECRVSLCAEKQASNYSVYILDVAKGNNSIIKEELENVFLDKYCTGGVPFLWLEEQPSYRSLSWALGYLRTSSEDSIVLVSNESSIENSSFSDKLLLHYWLVGKVRAKRTLLKILDALKRILMYDRDYCPSEEELAHLTGVLVSKNFSPMSPTERDLRYEVIKILCKVKGHADLTEECIQNVRKYFYDNKSKCSEIILRYETQLLSDGITPEMNVCLRLAISDGLDFLKAFMQLIPREEIAYEMLNSLIAYLVENKAEDLKSREQQLKEKISSMKSKLSDVTEDERKSIYHGILEVQQSLTEVRKQLKYYLHKASIIKSLDLNEFLLFLSEQADDSGNCLNILNQETVNMLIESARRKISADTSLGIVKIIACLPKEMKMKTSVKRLLSHVPKENVEWIIKLGLDQKLVTEDIDVLCGIMYEIVLTYEDKNSLRSKAIHVLEMHKRQLSEEVRELLELERNSASINDISDLLKLVERRRLIPHHYFYKLLPLEENSIKVLEQFTESKIQKLPEFIIEELKQGIYRCSDPNVVLRSFRLLLKLERLCWSDPEIRTLLRNPVYTEYILQDISSSFAMAEIPDILLKEILDLPRRNFVAYFLGEIQVNDINAKLQNPDVADEDKKKTLKSIADMKLSDTAKIVEMLENVIRCDGHLRAEAFQTLIKLIPSDYEISTILLHLDITSLKEPDIAALKAKHFNLTPILNEIIKNLYTTCTDHAELSSLLEVTGITELSFKQFCLLLHFAKYSSNKEARGGIKRFIEQTNYGMEKTVDIMQYLDFLEAFCMQNDCELNTLFHCVEEGYGVSDELLCFLIDVLQSNIHPTQNRGLENILFNISLHQHVPKSVFYSLLRVINVGDALHLSPEFIVFVANICHKKLSRKALLSVFSKYRDSFIALCGIANYGKEQNIPSSILHNVAELLISPNENTETRMLAAAILAHQEERNIDLPTIIAVELQQVLKDLVCSKLSEEYQPLLDFLHDDDHSFHKKFYELRGLISNQAVNTEVLWKCCINYCCSKVSEEYKKLFDFLQNDCKTFHERFYVLRGLSSSETVNKAVLSNFSENEWRKELFSYNLLTEMMQREDQAHEFSLKEFRDNINILHEFLAKEISDKILTSEAVYEALLQKQRTYAFGLRDGINVLIMLQSNAVGIDLLFSSSENFVQKLKYSWLSHSLEIREIKHTSAQLDDLCKYLVFKTTVVDQFLCRLKEKSSILQLTEFFRMLIDSHLQLSSKENFLMDGTNLLTAYQWKKKLAQYLARNMLQKKLKAFKEYNSKQVGLLRKSKEIIKKYCTTDAALELSIERVKERSEKFLAYLLLTGWSEQSLFQLVPNLDTESKLLTFFRVSVIMYDYKLKICMRNNKKESLDDIFKKYPAKCWEEKTHTMALYNSFKGTYIKTSADLIKEICEINANTELEYINERKLQAGFEAIMEKYNGWSVQEEDAIKHWALIIREDPDKADLFEKIAIVNRAVEISCRFRPREIQLLTVLILLQDNQKKGCLAQVNTGEGKTVIIAMIAAIHCLNGHTVDVVTSSPELARPQSQEMKHLFSLLGLTVAHNTEKNEKICYEANIVYGAASNFQGDILRDEYNNLGIRCKRKCDIAIVDEVDSMLIDNRNYKVMLSSPMPAMNHLEPILALIWVQIDLAATAVVEKNGLLYFRGERLQTHFSKEEFVKMCASEYVRKIISEEETDCPTIQIPKHLRRLVSEVQLNRWIECALYAKYGCEKNKNYIIKDDKIIPVDASNTGVVQQNMHWNDGLHQFLQIKHGLRITPENLCTNFISNVAYFRRYSRIYGLTGTLGSKNALDLLKNVYNVNSVYLPPFRKEQHLELSPIMVTNETEHYESIVESSVSKLNNGRAVLIITKYIAEAQKLYSMFVQDFGYKKQKVKIYQTEADSSVIKESLKPGEVIIATNIAGRGTDIKLLHEIELQGGLHVCITFLPSTLRTEKQNVGRTSRMGQKGTSQFIILSKHKTITEIRKERDEKEEIALQNAQHEIERVYMHDEVFAKFCRLLEDVRSEDDSNNDIMMKALEERFAIWFKLQHRYFQEGKTESIMQNFEFFEHTIKGEVSVGNLIIENPYFHVQIGNRFLEGEEYDEGIKHYSEAIKMDPDFVENAYYNRGYAYIAKYGHDVAKFAEELCAAVEDFKKAKDIIERHEQYLLLLQLTHGELTQQVSFKRIIYAVQKSAIERAIGTANEMKKDKEDLSSKDEEDLHKGIILQALEKKWNLQITHHKLQAVFKDSENIALYENNIALSEAEIKESENNGCIGSFEVKMIKPSINWWAAVVVAVSAVLQIISGIVLLCLRIPAVGYNLCVEGTKDIIHLIEHVVVKRDFDWKQWGIRKAVSLVTGAVVFGCSLIQNIGKSFLSGLQTAASATCEYAMAKAKTLWQEGVLKSAEAHTEELNYIIQGLTECGVNRGVLPTLQDAISSELARPLEDALDHLLSDECQEELVRKILEGMIGNENIDKYARDIAAEITCNKKYLALNRSSIKNLNCIHDFIKYFISAFKIEVNSRKRSLEAQRPKQYNHTPNKCRQLSEEIAAQVSVHVTMLAERYILAACLTEESKRSSLGAEVQIEENEERNYGSEENVLYNDEVLSSEIQDCLQKSTAQEILVCLSDIAEAPIRLVNEKGKWLHTIGKDKVGCAINVISSMSRTEAAKNKWIDQVAEHSGMPENKLKHLVVKQLTIQNKSMVKERLMLKLYKEELQKMPRLDIKPSKSSYLCREQYNHIAYTAFADGRLEEHSQRLEKGSFERVPVASKIFKWHPDYMLYFKHTADGAKQITEASAHNVVLKNPVNCKTKTCVLNIYPAERGKSNLGNF